MAKISLGVGVYTPTLEIMPPPVLFTRAPLATDRNFSYGQIWVYKNGDNATIYVYGGQEADGDAIWSLASPGASEVDTLTGDSGGALSPSGGNITLAGGTNIATSGSGSTITFNLDAAISLATSVTSPIFTNGAGNDITVKMGDAAGANYVSFTDSADVEVASLDSNGNLIVNDMTVNGSQTFAAGITVTGGVVSLDADNASDAVNIGLGNVARVISIGNSGAAHVVAIGSDTGAASLTLKAGTGNFVLNGAATSTYTIAAATTSGTIAIGGTSQTGTFTLGGSDGAMTMNIANANGAKTINIGAGVSGNTISLGNGINTSAQVINIAGGASGADSTVNIMTGNASAGTITLNAATGNRATTINLGTGTGGNTLNLMSGVNAAAQTTNIASGESAGNQTVNILSGNAASGTQTLNLATGTGGKTVNLANSASLNVVTIGSTNTTSSTTIQSGTGDLIMTSTDAVTIDSAGVLELNSSAGVIGIGNDAVAQNINIGTGAAAREVTIGNTTTTSGLTLLAGTGNIAVTGTFESITSKLVTEQGFSYTVTSSPTTCTAANTGGVSVGTTGATNLLGMQNGIILEQFILGAGQTIIKPVMTSTGLLISGDLTATEGFEYNFGAARNNNPFAFTIGTSAAFYLTIALNLADVSGGDPYMIGFRKTEANNATLADYTDYALIGMNNGVSSTAISLLTELNAGGQVTTNTTDAWADGTTKTLRVLVSDAGVVTYTIDGIAPSVTAAFTFDNGDVVTPLIRITHHATAPGAVNLVSWACGFQ